MAQSPPALDSCPENGSILVVDDDPGTREIVAAARKAFDPDVIDALLRILARRPIAPTSVARLCTTDIGALSA